MTTLVSPYFVNAARERFGSDIERCKTDKTRAGILTLTDWKGGKSEITVAPMDPAILKTKFEERARLIWWGGLIVITGLVAATVFALYSLGALIPPVQPFAFIGRITLSVGTLAVTLAAWILYEKYSGNSALTDELIKQAALRLQTLVVQAT